MKKKATTKKQTTHLRYPLRIRNTELSSAFDKLEAFETMSAEKARSVNDLLNEALDFYLQNKGPKSA